MYIYLFQGIDISHRFKRKVHRKAPKSDDIYLRLLVKVSVICVLFHMLVQRSSRYPADDMKVSLCVKKKKRRDVKAVFWELEHQQLLILKNAKNVIQIVYKTAFAKENIYNV